MWNVTECRTDLLLVIFEQLRVLQISMELDLVDSRRNGGGLKNGIQMLRQVVAHADRLGQTVSFDLLHSFPGLLLVGLRLRKEWGVNQVAWNAVSSKWHCDCRRARTGQHSRVEASLN